MSQPRIETRIAEALDGYFAAVEGQRETDPSRRPALRPHFEKLDALARELPSDVNPRLRHFMESKSYEKARALLGCC